MKILITGGTGFFGSHLVEALEKHEVISYGSKNYDLTNAEHCENLFRTHTIDMVLHVAGLQGGIGFNKSNPVDILDVNIRMALNVFMYANLYKVPKIRSIISSCAYPDLSSDITEYDLYNGKPNESIASHAHAKRLLQALSVAYNKQFGTDCSTYVVTNMFGPRSKFHPENSKVTEAVIQKVYEAKQNNLPELIFWGTGAPYRQFGYAPDCARAISLSLHYNNPNQPLNIGPSHEITIRELVDIVVQKIGYTGKIIWDTTKPDGQMRKYLDIYTFSNMNPDFQWTDFNTAITETINWYTNERLHT